MEFFNWIAGLLKNGLYVGERSMNSDYGFTQSKVSREDQPIHKAAFSGDLQTLKSLLDDDPKLISAKGSFDFTPLHSAASAANVECVQFLIERGAVVDARDSCHAETPLFLVGGSTRNATHENILACVKLLLEHGADPNIRNTHRQETPIFDVKSLDVLILLAQYGADLDVISGDNCYPFENHAVSTNSLEIFKFWLDHGVDVNHVPGFRGPVLHSIVSEFKEDENKIEKVTLLLDYGANPNLADQNEGRTPLHYAVSLGNIELLKLLLDRGADPNFKDYKDETPLHLATQEGIPEVIQLLIEYGADPNIRNCWRRSSWDLAQKHPEIQAIMRPHWHDLPNVRPTRQELVQRLINIGEGPFQPCSEADILALEQAFNVILPASYKEFLQLIGRSHLPNSGHWDMRYDTALYLKDAPDIDFSEYCDNLPEQAFVFADRLGSIFLFFIADGMDDDPAIYVFDDGPSRTYKKGCDSLWDFIEEEVVLCEYYHKRKLHKKPSNPKSR